MRILTHNMVTCLIKNCPQKFPLSINAKKVEVVESEINIEFLKNLLPKLDWNALVSASKDLKIENFPENAPSELEDESTIKLLHNFLVQVSSLYFFFFKKKKLNHFSLLRFKFKKENYYVWVVEENIL